MVAIVYFVQEIGDLGLIKIGSSSTCNLAARLAALQTANGRNLQLLGVLVDGKEGEIHKLFDSCRIRGEWFYPAPDLISFINSLSSIEIDTRKQPNQIPLRVTDDVLERVDQHLARMKLREPGIKFTRVDAVRSLVVKGLDASEETEKKKRTTKESP